VNCWICGKSANSKEHIIKASDLKQAFGNVSQSFPLYYHEDDRRNIPVGSIKKSDRVKFSKNICRICNGSLTQPNDQSWSKLSDYLYKNQGSLRRSKKLSLKKIFPGATKESIKNIQLFFIKWLGCRIIEENVPFDISRFSKCILNQESCENLLLRFHLYKNESNITSAGVTKIDAMRKNDEIIFMNSGYILGDLVVEVIYCIDVSLVKGTGSIFVPTANSSIIKFNAV